MMLQPHALAQRALRFAAARIAQHLMHGMNPFKALPRVHLIGIKEGAFAAVRIERPHIGIAQLLRALRPGGFHLLAPAWGKVFVQIGANADIRIRGHQLQGAVARRVKAPGRDFLAGHLRAQFRQCLRRAVRGAGIQHINAVRLAHGLHPPRGESTLIFADGVYIHPIIAHKNPPSFDVMRKKKGM